MRIETSRVGTTNWHLIDPGTDEVPTLHGTHNVTFLAPTVREYVPAGHASHGVEGFESPSYVPATQSTQSTEDNEPDGE